MRNILDNRQGRLVITLFMAVLYIFLSLVPSIHKIRHHDVDHSDVIHNELTEQDLCHRSLYHHDFLSGCNHDGHLQSSDEDCQLCDCLFITQILYSKSSKNRSQRPIISLPAEKKDLCSNTAVNLSNTRAPPVVKIT